MASDYPKVNETTALLVLIVNIFAPGVGTVIAGLLDARGLNAKLILYGIIQLIVIVIGWIWAVIWSIGLYKHVRNEEKKTAKKLKQKEQQKANEIKTPQPVAQPNADEKAASTTGKTPANTSQGQGATAGSASVPVSTPSTPMPASASSAAPQQPPPAPPMPPQSTSPSTTTTASARQGGLYPQPDSHQYQPYQGQQNHQQGPSVHLAADITPISPPTSTSAGTSATIPTPFPAMGVRTSNLHDAHGVYSTNTSTASSNLATLPQQAPHLSGNHGQMHNPYHQQQQQQQERPGRNIFPPFPAAQPATNGSSQTPDIWSDVPPPPPPPPPTAPLASDSNDRLEREAGGAFREAAS